MSTNSQLWSITRHLNSQCFTVFQIEILSANLSVSGWCPGTVLLDSRPHRRHRSVAASLDFSAWGRRHCSPAVWTSWGDEKYNSWLDDL